MEQTRLNSRHAQRRAEVRGPDLLSTLISELTLVRVIATF